MTMKTKDEMLAMAVKFQVEEDITIEKRGSSTWAVVVFGGTVLDRDMNRHYEPMPSSRTQEFIDATRFSLEEAFEIAETYIRDQNLLEGP